MRPPLAGALVVTQLFGGNPASEQYINDMGQTIIGHDGIDIAAAYGDPVYPAYNGTIQIVDDGNQGFGLHAILTVPGSALRVLYGHLSSIDVSDGKSVQIHTPFAKAGSTGNSTGPHVHFSVFHGQADNGYGGAVDPITDFDRDVWPLLDLSNTNL